MGKSRRLSRVTRALVVVAGVALLVRAGLVARPRAQGRGPMAIVGARIVDGSGNEPFIGTIVFSGGRITAVGRQVEVPADAQRIDGAGRAVLPGLIDMGLDTEDAASDGGRRRLGRALAAGVTTAATTGAPPSLSADPPLPRLLARPADDTTAAATAATPATGALRNGTVAIGLDADPRTAATAARSAGRRIALAGLVTSDGDVPPARVAAAGLAPIDAVTAMTSGGAWALGLQSDRGLLAPGMRADLVLVAGDPTVSLDALGAVERVFLGGAEVDRVALLRVPVAAPAPPATAAAPASTAPAATAPSSPPLRARGRTPKGARLEPVPRSQPTAADDPAAPGAASTTETPAAALTAPGSAPPAAPALAVAERLRDALLDDFERGEAVSVIGPGWVGSGNDGGGPSTTIIMGRVVKGLRDHALLLSARMGAGRDPFARAALRLDANDRPVDVSRFRGLRFEARGEGRYRIVFVTRSVVDGRYHQSYFSGSPLWTPVNIPFASVGQNGAGDRVAWTGRDLVEVRFEMARDAGKLAWLELDNVTLY